MINFLTYDAKVAVLLAVFYLFYRLVLSRETFHRVNRVVLLLTAVGSFVLPLCVITFHQTVVLDAVPTVYVGDVQMAVVDEPPTPWWHIALPALFFVGVTVTLAHTLVSVARVLQLIRHSEQHRQADGSVICVTDRKVSPFSWFRYIVLNRQDYAEHDAAVLAHERGHVVLRHSWDVLLVDTLTALQWFNPAMWLLRQDLRAIHEYEADGAVLSQGFNARQYQYLLITKAAGIGGYSIANGISHSTLKNRIHMMIHKKSQASRLLKLLALLPIVGTALVLNAETVTDYRYDTPQKKQLVKKGKRNATVQPNGTSLQVTVVEQVPDAQDEAQTFKVRGVVKDKENGEPIVGAVIRVGNSTRGTVTDRNGEFTIEVKKGETVTGAYVGYASSGVTVGEPQSKFTITLQKDGSDEAAEKAYDVIEQMPQFPGGQAAMRQFLSENLRYPEEAFMNNVQGRVIVNFFVDKDGSVTDARVVHSSNSLLDAEALRVVSSMPNWTPGMQKGKPVRVRYTVPVSFRMEGGDSKPKAPETANIDDNIVVFLDGTQVTGKQLKLVNPNDILSITVDKEHGAPAIIVTTKKAHYKGSVTYQEQNQ